MIKLPMEGKFTQPNNSDKFGSIWASKNINLDEEGYVKLSPRTVAVADEVMDTDFGVPVFSGRIASGEYLIVTDEAVFNLSVSTTAKTLTQNSGALAPTCTTNSHGTFWQNRLYASADTQVYYRALSTNAAADWTSTVMTLTSGVRHYLKVFTNRQTLCVTNGNVVNQYNNSHVAGTALTIPVDFEIIGLVYNNSRMGVLTRVGTTSIGQEIEARFFVWDGTTTGTNSDAGVGSDACIAACPYKSSFAVLTHAGQLLYWNGGGFDVLASFPSYYLEKIIGNAAFVTDFTMGDSMVADGDIIYINMLTLLDQFGRKQEQYIPNMPSGVWCYDPKVGLYHRYSPSISPAYLNSVAYSNVSAANDTFTITSGTIPATGGIARLTNNGATVVGITLNQDYYIIKSSSTVFKLATTKANAEAGTAIDITGVGSSGTSYFWMYDLKDYGNSYQGCEQTGAIAVVNQTKLTHTDIFIGGDYFDTSLAAKGTLSMAIPYLENRGYIITPKIFSSQVTDNAQKLIVKFRPLKSVDSIIVKYRDKELNGVPVTSAKQTSGGIPNSPVNYAVWTSTTNFYTPQDLSEAKTYFDAGGELECELVAGVGAGQMIKITSIIFDTPNYGVGLAETPIGAAAALKSEFVIHNWETKRTITSDDTSPVEIPIGGSASWMQFKIELRGSEVTLEELQIINTPDKISA